MSEGANARRASSGALELAYVANGRSDGYVELHMNTWERLAGLLMVREAGGVIAGTCLSGSLTMQGLSPAPDGIVSTAFKYYWLELGPLNIGEDRKLTFPPAENCPGLYRFRLQSTNGEKRYIGETVRLAQRFNFYRNPGSTQATNVRVNEILLDHLLSGGQAIVDVVFGGVTLRFAEEPRSVDHSDKATRRLLEHAAIVFEAVFDIESLNLCREFVNKWSQFRVTTR